MARKTTGNTAAKSKTIAAVADVKATPAVETPAETAETRSFSIVVGAYPKTESRMSALWRRALGSDVPVLVKTVIPSENISEQLADCLEDLQVADDFVYVPANTFPPKRIHPGELHVPYVYVGKTGVRTFLHRLPVQTDKRSLMEILTSSKPMSENDILKAVSEANGSVPVEASFTSGNVVTPVNRGNPCEHLVIEAFLRKKFVSTNPEGWHAIEHLIDKLLKDE